MSNIVISHSFRLNRTLEKQEQLNVSIASKFTSWHPANYAYSHNGSPCTNFSQSYYAMNGSTSCHNAPPFTSPIVEQPMATGRLNSGFSSGNHIHKVRLVIWSVRTACHFETKWIVSSAFSLDFMRELYFTVCIVAHDASTPIETTRI